MHASMTLNNSSCSQETNTCKDLGGDTPRISIQEIRIGLWYPDRYQHGGGRSHTDQGKGSHTSVPAAKLPFSPDNGAQHKTCLLYTSGWRTNQDETVGDVSLYGIQRTCQEVELYRRNRCLPLMAQARRRGRLSILYVPPKGILTI